MTQDHQHISDDEIMLTVDDLTSKKSLTATSAVPKYSDIIWCIHSSFWHRGMRWKQNKHHRKLTEKTTFGKVKKCAFTYTILHFPHTNA